MFTQWSIVLFFLRNGMLTTSFFLRDVADCPSTIETYDEKLSMRECSTELTYHCGLSSDGKLMEFCADKKALHAFYCPVFDRGNPDEVQQRRCVLPSCPKAFYTSEELYKYPVCWKDIRSDSSGTREARVHGETEIPENTHAHTSVPEDQSEEGYEWNALASTTLSLAGVGGVLILNICILLSCKRCISQRRRENSQTTQAETELNHINIYDDIDTVLTTEPGPLERRQTIENSDNEYHHLRYWK